MLPVREEGLEPPSPGSEPGGLPLADPRSALFSLGPSRGGWTRTSALLFPKQAGLPLPHTSIRAATPHTNPAGDCDSLGRHFSPRGVSVRMARFELAFSWFPTTRPLQAGPHPERGQPPGCQSTQRESNPHIIHGKDEGYRYIMGALRRRAVSPEGLEPSPDRVRAGNAAANTLDSTCFVQTVSKSRGTRTLTVRVGAGYAAANTLDLSMHSGTGEGRTLAIRSKSPARYRLRHGPTVSRETPSYRDVAGHIRCQCLLPGMDFLVAVRANDCTLQHLGQYSAPFHLSTDA